MSLKSIYRHFPIPKFLNPPRLGLSFSDSCIKVIYFDKSNIKNGSIKHLILSLEKGSIVGGKIVNTQDVVSKLKTAKDFFGIDFVFFTIPDELVYIYETNIVINKNTNAFESVAFTIEENVPLSLSDTIFDFTPTNIFVDKLEYKSEVVVAASVKNEVRKFVEVIYESGFELVGSLHESQSIANALVSRNYSGVCHLIHLREGRISISLVKENIVYFVTLRSINGSDYTKNLLDEYGKFLEYSSRFKAKEGEETYVFICGDFEIIKNSIESMKKNYPKSKILMANVWTNVLRIDKLTPNIKYEESLSLGGPIGAVISDIM